MSATHRRAVGQSRPLRVGRVRYGGLWLGHHLGPSKTRRGSVTAFLDRFRPSPMADGPLLGVVFLSGLGLLAAAYLVGFALADWAATSQDDVGPAVLGAVIIGTVFFGLCYLVFASRQGRGRAKRADN